MPRTPTLADLDRCPHGRHAADPCLSCPDGQSSGNPYLTPGQRIGTSLYGDPLHAPAPAHETR